MELLIILAVVIGFVLLAQFIRKARYKRVLYFVLIAGIVWETVAGIATGRSLQAIMTTTLILSIPLVAVYAEWYRRKANGMTSSHIT